MAALNFDATTVVPDAGTGDPLPAGWYNVMVDESELKPTNDGAGARLATRFTVLDGFAQGRKIFTGFNIKNANPVAQEIAFKQLSALAHAVGVLQVQDSAQLHGIPLKVRVKIKPASGGYEPSNDITAYKNINEAVTLAVAPAAAPGVGGGMAPQAGGFGQPAPTGGFGQPVQQPVQQQQMQQQPVQQMQQPVQQPVQQPGFGQQQQPMQMVQQPVQQQQVQQPMQQPAQEQQQVWAQPNAQQPWTDPNAQAQQPQQQMQQQVQQPVQQPVQQMQQQPVMQEQPAQQMQQQQPVQQAVQQPVQQQQVQQQAQQPVQQQAADPAALAGAAVPPWQTQQPTA